MEQNKWLQNIVDKDKQLDIYIKMTFVNIYWMVCKKLKTI